MRPVDPHNYPCGHPRTPENTQRVGIGNGVRCRECRRKIALRHWHTKAKHNRSAA